MLYFTWARFFMLYACKVHPPHYAKFEDFNLVIGPSSIKGAGDGVHNFGNTIPEGVLFGPYSGDFYTPKEFKKIPDSGNAWKINNPDGPGVLGYVDPGVNPDQKKHWMAKVNCSNNNFEQNLLGLQFKKQIFYR